MRQQKIGEEVVYWIEDGKYLSKIVQSSEGVSVYDVTEKIKDQQYVFFMFSFGPDRADVFLEGDQVTIRVRDGVPPNPLSIVTNDSDMSVEVNISDEAIAEMEGDDKQSAKLLAVKLVREILGEAKVAKSEHPERWVRDFEINL